MALESGALAKGAAALLLVGGGGAGAYYGYHHLASKEQKGSSTGDAQQQTPAQTHEATKYDKALIEFLKGDKHDITFEVKKTGATEADLKPSDLALSGAATTVAVKVRVGTATKGNFKVAESTSDAKVTELKAHNNGKDWTWSCSFEFKREGDNLNGHTLEDDSKNRILGDSDKGLFGILKKDISTYTDAASQTDNKWTKQKLKEVKTKFIEECAKRRGTETNREIEGSQEVGEKLTTSIPAFVFVAKADAENKLAPKVEASFKEWFKEEYGTNTYNTSGGSGA